MIYYKDQYTQKQRYTNLVKFETAQFLVYFDQVQNEAINIPFSPFGGIVQKNNYSLKDLQTFLNQLKEQLKHSGINKIILQQPPHFYNDFITSDELISLGFTSQKPDINQYVPLDNIIYHVMEKRLLRKKHSFTIEKSTNFSLGHQFISDCRQQQGLTINITRNKLLALVEQNTAAYNLYLVKEERELACAVITVDPNPDVRYYYLPATHNSFKNLSPMVYALDKIYMDAKIEGFQYLDLGRSSIDGFSQKGLFNFKKNMGAQESVLHTFEMIL
jgi:hypothetical protein